MLDAVTESPVEISVAGLVRLQQYSAGLSPQPARVHARQGGEYLSRIKGRGMEFSESRAYTPGDDIRNLDWRVMARTGEPYTKLFREERERPVFFWVDFRAPMFFATRGCYKSVLAARLASLLAWSASAHSDRVGGLIFSDTAHHEFKPQRGKRGVLRMIRALVDQFDQPEALPWRQDPVIVSRALSRLRRVAKPGSLVFLLSDFRCMDDAARQQLMQISRCSEVVMLFIHDPLEHGLPPVGRYRVSDGLHERVLDTTDRELLHAYQQQFETRLQAMQQLAGRCRARFFNLSTSVDMKQLAGQLRFYRS